jgi:hypothetical protein
LNEGSVLSKTTADLQGLIDAMVRLNAALIHAIGKTESA